MFREPIAFAGLALAVLAAACAGNPRQAPAAANATAPKAAARAAAPAPAPSSGIICAMERPTGSNIAKRVCWLEEDLARSREQSQDLLRRAAQQGSVQRKP